MGGGGGGGDGASGPELSTDNVKGIVLALLSSGFIGASFIIKKKGLKKAASSGVRAGTLSTAPLSCWFLACFFNASWRIAELC